MTAADARVAEAKRWYWQRASAAVLAACVVVHLAMVVYATHGGLTAAEILARTRGNWAMAAYYAVFVVACAVHVPIGVANVAREWLGIARRGALAALSLGVAALILILGLRAVWAVTAPA